MLIFVCYGSIKVSVKYYRNRVTLSSSLQSVELVLTLLRTFLIHSEVTLQGLYVCVSVRVRILPTTISRTPIKGSRVMLSVQHRATQEMMKAMMRMRRPMIIRAATAWAQAGVRHKRTHK